MEDIIIIDNKSYNYSEQLQNGIPIKDFDGDIEDSALYHLRDYLINRVLPENNKKMNIDGNDVRNIIQQDIINAVIKAQEKAYHSN